MSRILRYEVPVDGKWHLLTGHSEPLHVECRNKDIVEFWAWELDGPDVTPTAYSVFGTGHPVNEPCSYVGTAVAPGGYYVWHLMRRS